jgi:hypothetical protein
MLSKDSTARHKEFWKDDQNQHPPLHLRRTTPPQQQAMHIIEMLPPKPPLELPLRPETLSEPCRIVLKEIAVLRDQIAEQRTILGNERRDSELHKGHLIALQHEFMNASANLVKAAPNITAGTTAHLPVLVAWDQLQLASNRAAQLEKVWQERERELELLGHKLREKEAQLYGGEVDPPTTIGFEARPRGYNEGYAGSARTTSTNPLEDEYYDRIGDIHLLRERLFNFEAEHRRLVAMRDAQWKGGHKLDPPDSVFFDKYLQQRREIISEYSSADQDVQRLKAECREMGLKVEEPILPPFDEAHYLDQSRRDEQSTTYVHPSSLDGRYDIDNKARIAIWLSDVRKEGPVDKASSHSRNLRPNKTSISMNIPRFKDISPKRRNAQDSPPLPERSQLQILQENVESYGVDLDVDENDEKDSPRPFFHDPPRRRYSEPAFSAFGEFHLLQDISTPSKLVRHISNSKSVP